MKTLVLALLFANLAFFGYAYFVGAPSRGVPAVEPGPAIPRIRLASEARDLPARKCLSVGPFADPAVAERTVLWLRGEGRAPQLRTTAVDAGTGYWVRVEAGTLQQATRVALRLRAAGVADVEVLPPGEGGTTAVVSLGIYSERERAERRVAELRPYALNPAVVEQSRSATNWWIDVPRRPEDPAVDLAALQKAVPAATGIVMEVCPAVLPPATPAKPESESATGGSSGDGARPAGAPGEPAGPTAYG